MNPHMAARIRALIFAGWVLLAGGLLAGCQAAAPAGQATATLPPAAVVQSATATLLPSPTPPPSPTPTPDTPAGQVIEVVHDVAAHPRPGNDWEAAAVDMPLFLGGEVWAKEAATAMVRLLAGGRVRVAPNTVFSLTRPDDATLQLNIQEGQAWINVEGLAPGETFQVETPAAVAAVRGTRFSVRVLPDGTTLVSVQDGLVNLSNPSGGVDISAGKLSQVTPGSAPTPPQGFSNEEYLRWGMAVGPALNVILPVGDFSHVIQWPGMSSGDAWSFDSSVFHYNIKNPSTADPNIYQNESIYYRPLSGDTFTPTVIPTDTYSLAYNPKKDGVVFLDNTGRGSSICVSNLAGNSRNCFNQPNVLYDSPAWSPDGEWIMFQAQNYLVDPARNLFRARPDGSELTQLTDSEEGNNLRAALSPDGALLAYAWFATMDWTSTGDVWVAAADGSSPRKIFSGVSMGNPGDPLLWTQNGQNLVLASPDGLFLVGLDGTSIPLNTEPGPYYYDPAWSPTPTGWPLIFHYSNPDKKVSGTYSLKGPGEPMHPFSLGSWGPIWSPDGRWCAVGFNRSTVEGDVRQFETTIYLFQPLPLWP